MPSECLECLIGATRVEVPLADVERLLEYRASPPPPLAEPWVGGIGVESSQGRTDLFLSISLSGVPASESRETRGLLLRSAEGRPRWAVEVDRVVGLQTIDDPGEPRAVAGWACPSDWLRHGLDARGRPVRWLDVRAAELTLNGGDVEAPR
jgi:hypothetical protein